MLDDFDDLDRGDWPTPPPPARDPALPPLWQSIHGGYHALRMRVQQALADHCLDASEACVLVHVLSYPGCSPGELRRVLGFHRSTLSSLLGRLEADGLIERSAPHFDRRRLMIDLTPTGASRARMARDVLADVEEELDSWLTPAERRGGDAPFAAARALIRNDGLD